MREDMKDYSWVTNEMFQDALLDFVRDNYYANQLVMEVPGVYELVSEHLNNVILEELEKKHLPMDNEWLEEE